MEVSLERRYFKVSAGIRNNIGWRKNAGRDSVDSVTKSNIPSIRSQSDGFINLRNVGMPVSMVSSGD